MRCNGHKPQRKRIPQKEFLNQGQEENNICRRKENSESEWVKKKICKNLSNKVKWYIDYLHVCNFASTQT